MIKRLFSDFHGGALTAPASKSEAQRALLLAALSDAPTHVICAESSRDIDAMAGCLRALGAQVERAADGFFVEPMREPPATAVFDCGESGAVLRFLLPLAAALGISARFRLRGRLGKRPIAPLLELLTANGCRIEAGADELSCTGRLRGTSFSVDGSVSSQFVSGLLIALPLSGGETTLSIRPPRVSTGYIDLTRRFMERFGMTVTESGDRFFLPQQTRYTSPGACTVGGDWSNAAFFLCAGASCCAVKVSGLERSSAQPDRRIVSFLERFGAQTVWKNGELAVRPKVLRGIMGDLSGCPDLLPPLCAVAAVAQGETRFFGIERLRHKESDRPRTLADMLSKCGIRTVVDGDTMTIFGGRPHGAMVDAASDHRIAMTAALLSLSCPITLSGAEAVEKSNPNFWTQWEGIK